MSDGAKTLELALAQLNPVVGDLVGNAEMVIAAAQEARAKGAEVVLFPELILSGYPPEDLVLREDFLVAAEAQLQRVAAETSELVCIVGTPLIHPAGVANALCVLGRGEVIATARKQLLPNYGVFDEQRYFVPGDESVVAEVAGFSLGLTICEDAWSDAPVCSALAANNVDLIVNASASPFHIGKASDRETMLSGRAQRFSTPIAYCNLVGGQDELIFDGASVVVGKDGTTIARAKQFETDLLRVSIGEEAASGPAPARGIASGHEEIYSAIVLGIRDYVEKNGFPGVIVGVSGGIDSALVLALACDALGPQRVWGVTMPSQFNSAGTRSDGHALIERLGVGTHEFAIESLMKEFESVLSPAFAGTKPDQTEENIQARIRGMLLMALSNKFGSLVLTTGNKSETAVGYATLYGDMAGGFAPLKDVPKQLVFALSRWRNGALPAGSCCEVADPIPVTIIERPPSAELRAGQSDEQSLGGYEQLDAVIERYVEQDQGLDEIVQSGFERDYVERILRLIDRAEYKRRQAPPGVKITQRAFGRDRRMPITARRRYR
jgi:NAD+ synthase (glutamine-hydrolysing)